MPEDLMPEAVEMGMHYSLIDYVEMAGWSARPLVTVFLGLIIVGIKLFVKKPDPGVRWGYTIVASLPFFIGMTGTVTGLITAFSTLGSKPSSDLSRFFGVMGEVILPLGMGLFGSAIAMTLAFLVWMRGMEPAKQ